MPTNSEKEVIRQIMKRYRITQAELAEAAGFRGATNIAEMLNLRKGSMKVENLYRLTNALGCDLIVRDRARPSQEWVISYEKDEPAPEKVEPPKDVEPEPVPAAKPFTIRTKPKPVVETQVEEVKEKPRPKNGRIPIW